MKKDMTQETRADGGIDARALYAKITWRLIPYMFVLYILAYLDRVNVGFAAMDMKRDLHLSDTVYGTGAGIFFLGSSLFDLPSNLLLVKVGARVWIARIMITWGVVAALMMLVRGPWSFYSLRFLLGVSEAGFFPGMILYLTYWFPTRERARAVAKFMTATSIAGVVGAPLSSLLLKLEGAAGLRGWQWLFLMEGVPSVLMGISVLFFLRNNPDDAPWLSDSEKLWLDRELEEDRRRGGASQRHNLMDAFRLPMVWLLAAVCFVSQVAVYVVNLWMPLILSSFIGHGVDAATHGSSLIARYATVPYLAAAIFTVIVGWSSDRSGERRWHIAGCLLLSGTGFGLAAAAHSVPVALGAFTLAAMGVWSMMGPFWTVVTRGLGGAAAAGGVALIQIIAGVGGFTGPYLTGRLRDATNGFGLGLLVVGGLAFAAAGLMATMRLTPQGDSPAETVTR